MGETCSYKPNKPTAHFSINDADPNEWSALKRQVGGDHYKDMKIQVVEFCHANNIPFLPGNVIKYVTRYAQKNGIQDLEKARHYIDLLIEMEQKNEN